MLVLFLLICKAYFPVIITVKYHIIFNDMGTDNLFSSYEFLHTVNIVHKNNSFLGLEEL